ncbi:MAG: hypothetical protein COC15_02815 [Legionellales bacterium]|nr:MAG: hypothetical protein COC15_02815 [Legionellales bacterium]
MHSALKFNLPNFIQPLDTTAWRVVEDQSIASTRKLVDSFEEHELLEQLIEQVKPEIPQQQPDFLGLHYLLFTPFRYPPLQYGSRFGNRSTPALWYGSDSVATALSEVAFYRLYFLRASNADFGVTEVRLTAFAADISTTSALDLTAPPFAQYTAAISAKTSYSVSQALGQQMRDANINAFQYYAARSKETAINIALFTPKAFKTKQPKANCWQTWICIADQQSVEFYARRRNDFPNQRFRATDFMVAGVFPTPN